MEEVLIPIYDGKYEISNFGNLYSNARKTRIQLAGKIHKEGYREFIIRIDNKPIYLYAHRLVAQNFIDNPENYSQVNHKDGNKLNNHVDNLEWVTSTENLIHARDNKLLSTCKINMESAREIRRLRKLGTPIKVLESMFGIKKTQIGYIIQNKRWVE